MSWFTQNAPQTLGRTAPDVQPNTQVGSAVTAPTGTQDYAGLIKQFQDKNPSGTTQQLVAWLNQQGVPAMLASHAGGSQASDDKVVLPNGNYYDIRNDSGWVAPGQPQHWDPNVPVFDAAGNSQNFNAVLQAKGLPTFQFTPGPEDGPQFGGQQGQGGSLGGYANGAFLQPWGFNGVSPDQVANSPAYKFRFDQGIKALLRNKSAAGLLRSGGTMQDLEDYGSGLASTEYGNEWQRGFQNEQARTGLMQQQAGNLSSFAQLGLRAAEGQGHNDSTYASNQINVGDQTANANAAGNVATFNNFASAAQPIVDWLNRRGQNKLATNLSTYANSNPNAPVNR